MSIAPMKKLEVWTYASDAEKLSRALVRLRCVDVDTVPLTPELSGRFDVSENIRDCEKSCAAIEKALEALYPYSTRKKSFVKKKISVNLQEFTESGRDAVIRGEVFDVCTAVSRVNEIDAECAALMSREKAAKAWSDYDLPLDFAGTGTTSVITGTLPATVGNSVIDEKTGDLACAYSEVGTPELTRRLVFFCYKGEQNALVRRLSQIGFARTELGDESMTALQLADSCASERSALSKERVELQEYIASKAGLLDDIETLYDVETTRMREAELRSKLAKTGECAVLQGWLPADSEQKAAAVLEKYDCAYGFSEPKDGDDVPVKLQNNFFARNFEWVIGMYSLPAYGSYDPTFIMAICYCILFSMMFADVGYGLLLVLGGFLAPKILGFEEGTKRAFNMFGWCGIASVISGILFGGYFGDLPIALAKMINPAGTYPETLALLVDPVLDPMTFLIVGLGAGFLHLVTGQAIKFCIVWKQSKWDAICDYAFYWIIYIGIILLILVPSVGMYVTIAGAVLVVLTAGRKEKNIFMKLPKGLLGLYGLVNFGSDIISYSRILAIALSGTVLAQVFNILATMSDAVAFRIIGTPVILIVGHVLNLALSALSAFVHSSRLQYVEFFGKFYEDGGRPYAPMLPASRFTHSI